MRFFGALGFNQPQQEQYTTAEPQREAPQQTSVSHSYFEKKGEVNELKRSIKGLMDKPSISSEDMQETLKKVIAVMTLGIDLSSVFTDVLMLSYTTDIISKKMIYLYIINYAETNEETAIMAINTFLKDCAAKDGKIRGLALRTLCALRVPAAMEYIKQQVLTLLDDRDPYVRKIAVLGCLKLYYLDNAFFEEQRLQDRLYNLIKDPNRNVVDSVIHALNEIMTEEGGMAINSKIVFYLMNRFEEFDNYGRQTILGLLLKYTPKNDEERINFMNLLDESLKRNHIPLRMAIISVFVHFTVDHSVLFEQVVQRVAPVLVSTACMAEDEELYNVLHHVLMFTRCGYKQYFQKQYKLFYVKPHDRNYNQRLKIQILVNLVNKETLSAVTEELVQYTGEKDPAFARYSINGLGEIIKKFPDTSVTILKVLLSFMGMNKKETIKHINSVLKDVLPYVERLPSELTSVFETFYEDHKEEESVASLLCIISLIPDKIGNAPYILDSVIDALEEDGGQYGVDTVLCLLSTVVRVFVSRPGEMLPVLSRLYALVFNDEREFCNHVDLVERASFYYNMLQTDVEGLKKTFQHKPVMVENSHEAELRLKQEIKDFGLNDLRIIYKRPEELFVKRYEHFKNIALLDRKSRLEVKRGNQQSNEEEDEEDEEEDEEEEVEEEDGEQEDNTGGQEDGLNDELQHKGDANLLDLDDFEPGSKQNQQPFNEADFDQYFELDETEFQEAWVSDLHE